MNRSRTNIAIFIGVLVVLAAIFFLANRKREQAADAERFQGTWEGTMNAGTGKGPYRWRLVFKVSRTNGVCHVLIDEIDYGLKNVTPDRLTLGKLAIDFGSDYYSYHGVLHRDGDEMRGIWRWGQAQFLLNLKRTSIPDIVPDPLLPEQCLPCPGSDLQGLWKGNLTNQSSSYRLYLKIMESTNGNFRAEWDNIDLPALIHYPAAISNYTRPHLRVMVDGVSGIFNGNLDDSGTVITGRWRQAGSTPLTLIRVDPHDEEQSLDAGKDFGHADETDLPGHWMGALPDMSGVEPRIVLNIARSPDGSYEGTMDSPDKSLFHISLGEVRYTPPAVQIMTRDNKPLFAGKLSGGELSGTWHSGKMLLPLALERQKP